MEKLLPSGFISAPRLSQPSRAGPTCHGRRGASGGVASPGTVLSQWRGGITWHIPNRTPHLPFPLGCSLRRAREGWKSPGKLRKVALPLGVPGMWGDDPCPPLSSILFPWSQQAEVDLAPS